MIDDLVAEGIAPPDTDVASAVIDLNAVIDGLTLELLTAPDLLTREQAAAALRRALVPDRVATTREEGAPR